MENVITAIIVQKKNPDRVSVFLDGEFAFGLSRLSAAWLKQGDHLSIEKIKELKSHDEFETAYQKAIQFISYRARTEKEVANKLEKLEYSEDLISTLLMRLKEQGLIQDETFSKEWVQSRGQSKPRGHRMLAYELRQRGIDDEIIQQALAVAGDEANLAFRAAEKYARRLESLEWNAFQLKMSAFLARRGFAYSAISSAVHQVWDQIHSAGDTTQMPNGEFEYE